MLKELFDALTKQAVDAAGMEVFHPDAEPEHVYYLGRDGAAPQRIEAAPAPRQHKALSLQAVIAFAAKYAADVSEAGRAAVWYSRSGVVCLTADEERRDAVTLTLDLSPQLKAVQELERTRQVMSQAQLVLLLRTTFKACLGRSGNLLDIVRAVKFSAGSTAESNLQHGKRSVGKSVEQQITGTGAIPEYVTLEVPVFASAFPSIRGTVECALEPNPATETFQLIPLPGEVEQAVALGEKLIGERLAEQLAEAGAEDVPVYYGAP